MTGWDGTGWDGMGRDGMGWDGMGWDQSLPSVRLSIVSALPSACLFFPFFLPARLHALLHTPVPPRTSSPHPHPHTPITP